MGSRENAFLKSLAETVDGANHGLVQVTASFRRFRKSFYGFIIECGGWVFLLVWIAQTVRQWWSS